MKADQGRHREAEEIVRLRRAAAVGRLMLGELNAPLEQIELGDFLVKSRRELKQELASLRVSLRDELRKFCRQNFADVEPQDLAGLYDDLLSHGSQYHLPLEEFCRRVGRPRLGVLKGAPAHSTVHLSPWGLQTEYPEMHLARDVALAYNDAFDADKEARGHEGVSWRAAKESSTRDALSSALRRSKYSMRMCLISCFNLTEAYINAIAWEFMQTADLETLSKRRQKLLTEGLASLLEKLVKVPAIVSNRDQGPLSLEEDPLRAFRDLVKPFRDSVVHASPFSAPEQFGGYDKLERVYELDMPTVTLAVELTESVIGKIHRFLQQESDLPDWMPVKTVDGHLSIAH